MACAAAFSAAGGVGGFCAGQQSHPITTKKRLTGYGQPLVRK